ncbi:hypothetical protein N7499_000077 [Penicillium canescens]|uniref:Uncharacterized protein n=1 Tax=Penicillium canescens TaxID=5083 RepID=A0AAD6IG73_PENCN|nr:hypothetical protein N7444_011923 [Penicillium canescens]KAJ6047370.1 hypothetical protein N7460_003517 [Penicillium canescens]KAJ6100447.1 hypothetical protein N7499_000077 [Penicillium canescens]KAJ6172911.1 hypothetical protein N7485_005723 [Penicillium canescens]
MDMDATSTSAYVVISVNDKTKALSANEAEADHQEMESIPTHSQSLVASKAVPANAQMNCETDASALGAAWRLGFTTGYRQAIEDHNGASQARDDEVPEYDPGYMVETSSIDSFYSAHK